MGALNNPVSGVAAGTIAHFAANTAPAGWLKANGAAVSRSAYAGLFLAIGTTYGAGDGSTTFNVPDLRGEFVRGWDDGRGVDSGRAIGSAQEGQLASHTHVVGVLLGGAAGSNSTPLSGNANNNANYTSQATGGTTNSSENRPRNVAALACIKF